MNEAKGKRTKTPSRTLVRREERKPMSREQIITNAVMDKMGLNAAIFTADDILTVAGIGKDEITATTAAIESEILKLTDNGDGDKVTNPTP